MAETSASVVLLLIALALVLAVILIGAAARQFYCTPCSRSEGFMTYPYLDLWDTYDAGDRGGFYGLMEGRSDRKRAGAAWPSYLMRPPAFRGRVIP